MTTYCTVMNQGVVVDDLARCKIATGYGESEDRIQSCSAVVFFNANTRGAGIYHYPASGIRSAATGTRKVLGITKAQFGDQERCKKVIEEMAREVEPTVVLVFYGLSTMALDGSMSSTPTDPSFMEMRNYVKQKVPRECAVQLKKAVGGQVQVYLDGGDLKFSNSGADDDLLDLRGRASGRYVDTIMGCRVYWSAP